jgi:CRP-like cAMP-binding protein
MGETLPLELKRQEATEPTLVRSKPSSISPLGRKDQTSALIQQSALFAGMSLVDCTDILAAAQEKILLRRQSIFFLGEPIRQLWMLTSGSVKVMQVGSSGNEVILRVAGPGDMIGSFGLTSRDYHSSSAQAIHHSNAVVWDIAIFEDLSERFPLLRRNMLRVLGECLQQMDERFREISTEKVAQRLSSQLGRLCIQMGRRIGAGIEIALSREELAQLTGTTLFTVSRMLCQWEQLGIVETRREAVVICNTQALGLLSEGD